MIVSFLLRDITTIIMAIILLTAAACRAQSIDSSTIESLDLERYMGRWYEIARFDHCFESGMENKNRVVLLEQSDNQLCLYKKSNMNDSMNRNICKII